MKKKIIVVDDDLEFLSELEEALKLCEYDVRPFSNPMLVREAVALDKPDLILLDLKMKEKSGFQLACELAEDSGPDRPPIFVMTGHFPDDDLSQMPFAGIKACYIKPFDFFDLLSKIEKTL